MKKEYFVEFGQIVDTDIWYRTEDKVLTTIGCSSFENARDVAVGLYCDIVFKHNDNPDLGVTNLYTKKRARLGDVYVAIKSRVIWD